MSSYGMWLSAAGMQANDYRQTVLANNMANINTTGFKQDLAIVHQRRVESREDVGGMAFVEPVLDNMSGGLVAQPTHHAFEQGMIERTNNPLHMAIDGDGFFSVSDGKDIRYTRDGAFTTNTLGELVMSAGGGRWRVLGESDEPLLILPDGGRVRVSGDGTIRQGEQIVGRIQVVDKEDKTALRKVGENLFENREGELTPVRARIVGGALEGSNFDMMRGLASMIEVTRAYQLNATLAQLQDNATGLAVSRVGRVA